jgi:hypothetical protein
MAIARCKVMLTHRDEHVMTWVEEAGNPGVLVNWDNKAVPQELRVSRSGTVSPPDPKFPSGKCQRSFVFTGSYPQKGIPENEHFWEASPSLEFKLSVQNAAVDFEVGKHYYIDFVRVVGEGAE